MRIRLFQENGSLSILVFSREIRPLAYQRSSPPPKKNKKVLVALRESSPGEVKKYMEGGG